MECAPTWQEEEDVQGCSEPGGYWTVHLRRNTVLVDWQARPDDQPLQTLLTRIAPVSGAVDLEAQVDALRVAGPRLTGREQGHGAVRWHMVTEPRSKVSMPFLTRAPERAAMRKINETLEQQFQGQIKYALCNIARENGEAHFDNKPFVTSTDFFAVAQGLSDYSGGAPAVYLFRHHIRPEKRSSWPGATACIPSCARERKQPG